MRPSPREAAGAASPSVDESAAVAPFKLEPDQAGTRRVGVLLVHGFVGSPFEMRPLGEALAARGMTVSGIALAGHGPHWRALRKTTWREWYASVEAGFDELRARCDVVGVCGQSLGGLLSLELARQRPAQVAALATLAAALWIPPWMAKGIRKARGSWLWRRIDVPRWGGSDIRDRAMNKALPTKGGMPMVALNEMLDAMDAIDPRLGEIRCPTLVAHSTNDHTIPFSCADHLAATLAGPVERMTLEQSFHVISLDVDREALFSRVGEFFTRRLALPSPALPANIDPAAAVATAAATK